LWGFFFLPSSNLDDNLHYKIESPVIFFPEMSAGYVSSPVSQRPQVSLSLFRMLLVNIARLGDDRLREMGSHVGLRTVGLIAGNTALTPEGALTAQPIYSDQQLFAMNEAAGRAPGATAAAAGGAMGILMGSPAQASTAFSSGAVVVPPGAAAAYTRPATPMEAARFIADRCWMQWFDGPRPRVFSLPPAHDVLYLEAVPCVPDACIAFIMGLLDGALRGCGYTATIGFADVEDPPGTRQFQISPILPKLPLSAVQNAIL
jgi:hypothetical protein